MLFLLQKVGLVLRGDSQLRRMSCSNVTGLFTTDIKVLEERTYDSSQFLLISDEVKDNPTFLYNLNAQDLTADANQRRSQGTAHADLSNLDTNGAILGLTSSSRQTSNVGKQLKFGVY